MILKIIWIVFTACLAIANLVPILILPYLMNQPYGFLLYLAPLYYPHIFTWMGVLNLGVALIAVASHTLCRIYKAYAIIAGLVYLYLGLNMYIIKSGYDRPPFISRDEAIKLVMSCQTGLLKDTKDRTFYVLGFDDNRLPTPTMTLTARSIVAPALVDYYQYSYGVIWSTQRAVADDNRDAIIEAARSVKDRCGYDFVSPSTGSGYVWYTDHEKVHHY